MKNHNNNNNNKRKTAFVADYCATRNIKIATLYSSPPPFISLLLFF
jgi:hypothetical protein